MQIGILDTDLLVDVFDINAAQMRAEIISPFDRHILYRKKRLVYLCLLILSTIDAFAAAIAAGAGVVVGRRRR